MDLLGFAADGFSIHGTAENMPLGFANDRQEVVNERCL